MNQKYEDLLYQAGLTAQGCWDELGTYEQEAIEKFAELIVQECAALVKGQPHFDKMIDCNAVIKQHFGVEE